MTTETNAWHIEQAKSHLEGTRQAGARGGEVCVIGYENLKHIIQQAERARTLEASKNRCVKVALNRQRYIDKIDSENARLREALEDIAKETGTPCGRIAKAALKGKSE